MSDNLARWGGVLYLAFFFVLILAIISVSIMAFFREALPNNQNTELLGVLVNAVLTIGLLFLYYKSGKTQSSQESALTEQVDALSKQAETLTAQTEELSKQRGIMQRQQDLEEELHKLILDIEGYQAINETELKVCVSNHGGGVAQNVRIVSLVDYPNQDDLYDCECRLKKITEKEYLTGGNSVAPEVKEIEMKTEVLFSFPPETGDVTECNFPELTQKASNMGVSEISIKFLLKAEDQHGNTDQVILYEVEDSFYQNMALEEFLS